MESEILVTHIVTGLGKGGAETMLYNILKYKQTEQIRYKVISLGGPDYYADKIRQLGVDLVRLDVKRKPFYSFRKAMRTLVGCDVLCCWMYHANLFGLLVGRIKKIKKTILCVRHSDLSKENNKGTTLFVSKVCARWSKHAFAVAYNGETAKRVHEAAGYDATKSRVLLNGCDTDIYTPVPGARAQLFRVLDRDITDKKILLSASRWNPIKDIPNFLSAFARVTQSEENCVAVMCGKRIDEENTELMKLLADNQLKVRQDVFLLGQRDDLPVLMSACDLYVLHSASEAFPNTLIEAMACEANCVTTDVGEVKSIVGDGIAVVPAKASAPLADAILAQMNLPSDVKIKQTKHNRKIVQERFSICSITKDYETLFLG